MSPDARRVKESFVALLDLPDAQARQAFLEREYRWRPASSSCVISPDWATNKSPPWASRSTWPDRNGPTLAPGSARPWVAKTFSELAYRVAGEPAA
jgi:hypothetical protein